MTPRIRQVLQLLSLALPLLVLAAQSAQLIYARAYAPEFHVAVRGYDPRDLVHGKYVMIRYDWDDPRTERPARADLLDQGRFYVPEGDAQDLQTIIRENPKNIMATIHLQGRGMAIKDLSVNGRSWQEALAAWRQNRDNRQP
jgi:hypothetical protein